VSRDWPGDFYNCLAMLVSMGAWDDLRADSVVSVTGAPLEHSGTSVVVMSQVGLHGSKSAAPPEDMVSYADEDDIVRHGL
jgi:hypothetical protein